MGNFEIKRRIKMNGTFSAMANQFRESINDVDAIKEFVDNPIKNANLIEINYDRATNTLKVFDNWGGFTLKQLEKVFATATSHLNTDKDSLSYFGYGLKKAIIRLINHTNGQDSSATIISSNGERMIKAVWTIENGFEKEHSEIYNEVELKDSDSWVGTEIIINNCVPLPIKFETMLMKELSETYATDIENGLTLVFNGHVISPNDYCYINNLGEDMTKEGENLIMKNGVFYKVNNLYFRDIENKNITLPIRVIGVYLPEYLFGDEKIKRSEILCENDSPKQERCGIYARYNGRYIMTGKGNVIAMLRKNSNSGGVGRTRLMLDLNSLNASLFEIYSTKSNGILNIVENQNLERFCLVKPNGKIAKNVTLANFLENEWSFLTNKIHKSFSKKSFEEQSKLTIEEIVESISKKKKSTKTIDVDYVAPIKINEDDIEHIINEVENKKEQPTFTIEVIEVTLKKLGYATNAINEIKNALSEQ